MTLNLLRHEAAGQTMTMKMPAALSNTGIIVELGQQRDSVGVMHALTTIEDLVQKLKKLGR